jgi:ADP-ribose pyrophosphatase YjhB (NUDIX family)
MRPGIDYPGIGSSALIFNNKGKVLLSKARGQWEFPTIAVRFGQRRRDAIRRHARRFGLEIEVHDILDVVNHILHEKKQHWLESAFIAQHKSGEVVRKETRWLRLHEITLDQLTEKSQSSFLKYVKKHGSNAPVFVRE